MKKYSIIALLLLMLGCAEESQHHPPSMSAVVNGQEYPLTTGNFTWEVKQGSSTIVTQTDAPSPNQIAKDFDPIILEKQSSIGFKAKDEPEISAYLWNEEDIVKEMTLHDNELHIPADKGQYIYEVRGKWSDGEASYTFVVEIE